MARRRRPTSRRLPPERPLGEWWLRDEGDFVVQAARFGHDERMRGLDNEETQALLASAMDGFVPLQNRRKFISERLIQPIQKLLSEEAYRTARDMDMRRPGGCPHREPCEECIAEQHV